MIVLFLSPHYPAEMPEFTRGLAEVGARVIGMADAPLGSIPARVRRHLAGYVQASNLADLGAAVTDIRRTLGATADRIDRIESLWEPHVTLAARLREVFDVAGMRPDAVLGFRDKSVMKDRLIAAGLRVPRYRRVDGADAVRAAAAEIGFPVVLKPIAGAGTAHTRSAADEAELEAVLAGVRAAGKGAATFSVEEYVAGDELTYDALTVAGQPVFESVAQYFPRPLESRNVEWISPAQIVYRDPHVAEFSAGVELGRGALAALGMGTGFVHMEWFRTPDGEAVLCEIACRPGGAKLMDQIDYANDIDVFREWARAVCWRSFEATPSRGYHTAVVFKRAQGQGRITAITGLDELRRFCAGDLVLEHLLPLGHPRRNWKHTLLSDGYVLVRHPDLDRVRAMMNRAITDLRLYAS